MMEYAVFSKQLQKISSIGTGRIVMLNYATHEKIKVNSELLAKIKNIENNK